MGFHSLATWVTLAGLSFLVVGGFVLWVYGSVKLDAAHHPATDDIYRPAHERLIQWFLLYGAATCFAGTGCLLTAAVMVL